jgi:hypothetical protein
MLRFTDGFCSQPLDIIRSWGASGAVQRAAAREESSLEFRTPSAFQDCPSTWRRIRRRGDDLSPAALLSLLRSANPCQVGYVWATANTPIPINLGEAARCFTGIPISIPVPPAGVGTYQIGGELPVTPETPFGALVYSSASILTERTPFVIKFNAVDRPDTEICPELPIPLLEIVLTPTLDFTSGDFAVIDPSAIDAATILATPTAAPLPGGSSATATPLVSPAPPPLMSPTSTPGSAEVVVPPLSAADAADMDAALEELLTESALPTGALGVFQAAANGATAHDLYLLSAGGVLPLTPGSLDDEQVPALDTHGQRVAYVAIGSDGLISIRMIDISTGGTSVLFTATPDLAPSLVAPAWSPVTPLLFVTLVNPAGEPGIYAIDVSDPSRIPSPTLLIANASSPAITVDGGYLAFSQGTSTRRDLVVMDLVSGISFPLSSPAEGVLCDHPAFDFTGVTLYFACVDTTTTNTTTIYRYQLNDLLPVPIAGELIGRFDAGPTLNIVTVSNGESILVSSFSDSEGALTPVAEVPLVELEGYTISHFRWRAYRADPSPSR